MVQKIDLSLFREKFIAEARDRIARMNGCLVYLEKNPGDTRLEGDLLREAHTLKGAAKMMGFAKISELAHRFEEALSSRKGDKSSLNQDLTDALFRALDALTRLVESLSQNQRETIDVADVIDRLRVAQASLDAPVAVAAVAEAVAQKAAAPAAPAPGAPAPPSPDLLASLAVEPGRGGIRVEPERLERLANLLGAAVERQLRQVDLRARMGELGRGYRRTASDLVTFVEDAVTQGIVSAEFASGVAPILRAGKKVFREIGTQLSDLHRREDEESTALGQIIEDLRGDILAIRMIPLSPLFDSFQRAVRDLSKQLGKEVEFLVRGGKTEIDRKVAEALTDPLIHIIRNAIDHGIEPPEARAEAKKPPAGKIVITATPKKGRVVIEVEDDGRGIDLQEVRETAVKKGLTTEKASYRLDDRELLSFLFRPGFTTARSMTEISGRGIGMDVVRDTAERFNGTVDIVTKPGRGTKVVLELPFTMAVSRALMFLVGGQNFGIPVMHSEGVFRFDEREIEVVEGKRVVRRDGAPVPLVWLSRLLDMPFRGPDGDGYLAILIRHSQRRIALVVDVVEGEFEVVVKDLGSYIGKIPLFMGSTILGTGEIALLLDVYDLVNAIRLRPDAPTDEEWKAGRVPSLLLVDETMLSRDMEQRVLAAAGYRVEAVRDAPQAFETLGRKRFDLVLASASLEGGAEFLGRLRATARFSGLPVVVVASRDDARAAERAIEAGARACVDREDFRAETIAPLVARLLGPEGGGA